MFKRKWIIALSVLAILVVVGALGLIIANRNVDNYNKEINRTVPTSASREVAPNSNTNAKQCQDLRESDRKYGGHLARSMGCPA